MSIYFLLFIVIFSGFLAGFKKPKVFYLLKATVIVGLETVIGSILFFAFLLLMTKSFLKNILITEVESFFVLILLVAVIDGFVIYYINRKIFPKFKIMNEIQTLCEYIIQWSLIYITVYQIVFDNIKVVVSVSNLKNLSLTNPSEIGLLVLPSLISVWISIILYKIKVDNI